MAKLKENSTILKHTGEEIIATEESVDEKLQDYAKNENIPTKLSQLTKDINFDERYYTESEMDNKLSSKSNTDHNHDGRYVPRGPITCDQLKGVW